MSTIERAKGLSTEEKRALVAKLLRAKAVETDPLVHRLFEAQVARTPDAVALTFGEQRVTYAELNARANRLAHHLRALGARPETLVALCVDRSPELVVGLLGILKSGAAYVPLDPHFPESRLALMLEDARVSAVLTTRALRDRLDVGEARVVCLDADEAAIAAQSAENPGGGASARNLAYVIYTSGSTGTPKGVQIPHGALANFLHAMRDLLGLTSADVLAAVTTLSFDIAALEIYLPLIQGARVDVIPRDVAADGRRLAERLEAARATFLQATPATWRLLLAGGWTGSPNLTMLCGGEALPRVLANQLLPMGKGLWNLYGPTETTIWSSVERISDASGPITIGRPIARTQLYVLDERLRPVPVGVMGELYIGGAGLARGYLRKPILTTERFVPDPFGKQLGARLYRTGDLARWTPDGRVECLGRVDHQVKVRGYRIELGDVESALLRHEAIRDVAVVARPDAAGEQALVAYMVVREGADVTTGGLRDWLLTVLPDYMVPATFVRLDALPLTPNGKVDRNALPEPNVVDVQRTAVAIAARGPIEDALASLWRELLGQDRIGVYDNFFDLGGHSLFATQLLGRVRDTFAVEPPLRDFLEDATIACLARLIEEGLRSSTGDRGSAIVPTDRTGALPLSFAQQRLWFIDRVERGGPLYNIPVAVRITGTLDVNVLTAALTEIVQRHEVLRTTFHEDDGVPRQVVGIALPVPLRLDDLSMVEPGAREDALREWLDAEASSQFDLSSGPLLHAAAVRLGADEHVVLVTMHHIASDGWSIGVLVREVAALYAAFHAGQASPLAEPAVQYADFAAWQRGRAPLLDGQLAYWTEQLTGVPPLELPADRPRGAASTHRGAMREGILPDTLARTVRALGRKENATTFMTLLAGFVALLHRYSNQTDFAVGTPIAGRTHAVLDGLIGCFVNTLALRADVSDDPNFRTLVGRVRATALGAYAHQELPFERLVSALQPQRDSAQAPLFQVMFALQNAPLPEFSVPGLAIQPILAGSGTAKFDLSVFVADDARGMSMIWEYDVDRFDAPTVDRMIRQYQALLEDAVARPDASVSALSLLAAHDQALMRNPTDRVVGLSDDEVESMLHALANEETAGPSV